MRNTKQQDLVLKIISTSYNHPTANMIYLEAKKEIVNISLGTIYRILNRFVKESKVRRIKMPDNIDRYDRIANFHPHFICYNCGDILDLDFPNNFLNKELNGNKIIDYEISIKGICKKCLKEGGKNYGIKRK